MRATLRCRCFCAPTLRDATLYYYFMYSHSTRHATRPTKDAQPRQTAAHLTPRALVLFDGSVLWWVCSHSQIRVKRLKKERERVRERERGGGGKGEGMSMGGMGRRGLGRGMRGEDTGAAKVSAVDCCGNLLVQLYPGGPAKRQHKEVRHATSPNNERPEEKGEVGRRRERAGCGSYPGQ